MTPFRPCSESNQHLFLASGKDLTQARQQVSHFMETTQLVVYQSISIRDEETHSGHWQHFWQEIETAIGTNRAFCNSLVEELAESGLTDIKDLLSLHPGYPSKMLHILTHMLDGFFNIDSAFYNLVAESHWLSEPLRTAIQQSPEEYWLVPVWHGPVTRSLLHPTKK